MFKSKILRVGAVVLTLLLLVMVGTVSAGELASFDNPTLAVCNLGGLSISGTLTIGDTVYVQEYLNGDLRNTFTGRGGRYSGYVSRFSTDSYPYSFATILSFKDGAGDIIEQYTIEGACTAEDTGSVEFRELEVDATQITTLDALQDTDAYAEAAGDLASFDNPILSVCNLGGISISGTLTIGDTVYVSEYLNGDLRNTFTGRGGRYSGYVSRFSTDSYPYTFATYLSFKDGSGDIVEQYVIQGECTAEDTGSVEFRELEVDAFQNLPLADFSDANVDAYAGELVTFDNPALSVCNLGGLSITGTLTIGATVQVEEHVNGNMHNTFTGRGGRYSGYVSRFNTDNYPYTFATYLSFKDGNGNLIEQYVIEGDCTAEDSGSVNFREIELDVAQDLTFSDTELDMYRAGELASFDNPTINACNLNEVIIEGTLTIAKAVSIEEYINDDFRNQFAVSAGRYRGYRNGRVNAPEYPYTFAATLSFKDASGDIIEQYILEGDCTAEDTGSVNFREIELDAPMFEGIS